MKQFIKELKEFTKELRQRINESLNDETKRYLKIFGIWYGVVVFSGILWLIPIHWHQPKIDEILSELAFIIFSPFGLLVAFLPAILTLKFLFSKIQNIVVRVLLTAVIIPCTNMIYFFIGYLPNIDAIITIAVFLGFFAIFWFVPIAFLTALFMPEKLLPRKYICAGTLALMDVFGLFLAMHILEMFLGIID